MDTTGNAAADDGPGALPTADNPVEPLRPLIQDVLDEFLDRQRAVLASASADLVPLVDAAASLLSGGKRLRPAFCYWGWRGAGGSAHADQVIAAGAALELFQASALVHDDLIDGSDTRRGRPAAHRRFADQHRVAGWRGDPDAFGAAAAILLGDLLLAWSDELFDAVAVPAESRRRGRAVFERMRTEVGGGQYLDLLEQVSGADQRDGQADRARTVIRYKSARYSVEHPLIVGAELADASPAVLAAFGRYGGALGEAFQLRDDILGVFGDPATTGKPAGDDLREGKRTLLVAYALERADAAQAELVDTLLGDPKLDSSGVETLRAALVDTQALARVEALVTDLVAEAHAALAGAELTADARQALTRLAGLASERAS